MKFVAIGVAPIGALVGGALGSAIGVHGALTIALNKRYSQNYQFTASYTYSAFRGNYPGLFRSENGLCTGNEPGSE